MGLPADVNGYQWSDLKVPESSGRGAKVSQQRHADSLPKSASLVAETKKRLHELLVRLGVDDAENKQCVELKLLRSPPGAERQILHLDTPETDELRKGRRRVPGSLKAPHCVSVILHLNPGATHGTHTPTCPASQLPALVASPAAWCDESAFHSVDMYQGDVALFYHDVPHFGPAHKDGGKASDMAQWRWVLFAMFSPESGANQDTKQTFLNCEPPKTRK